MQKKIDEACKVAEQKVTNIYYSDREVELGVAEIKKWFFSRKNINSRPHKKLLGVSFGFYEDFSEELNISYPILYVTLSEKTDAKNAHWASIVNWTPQNTYFASHFFAKIYNSFEEKQRKDFFLVFLTLVICRFYKKNYKKILKEIPWAISGCYSIGEECKKHFNLKVNFSD